MKQLPLPISPEPVRSFDNFIGQGNLQAVEQLRLWRQGAAVPIYLWGARGCGKTHLLRAAVTAHQARGQVCAWFDALDPTPWLLPDDCALVAVDNVERLDAAHQASAFALFELAKAQGAQWLAAGAAPPVDLPLREDLRTRLGWGHVFALAMPLEHEVRAALRREADRRGIFLGDEVMAYLLTRFARDLASLMALLDQLDHYAMATQRTVTVPLLKQMLRESEAA